MKNECVGVVGAGTIGSGLALDLSLHGFRIQLKDTDVGVLDSSRHLMKDGYRLAKMLSRKEDLPPFENVLNNIRFTLTYDGFEEIEFVIENVTENFTSKQAVYSELSGICPPETVYAANTSCISITKLGRGIPAQQNMIGLHFMNPVPVSKLVEVVRGAHTSEQTVARAKELVRTLGKTCVVVNDMPGFVTNRVMMPMINESIWAVHDQVAKPSEVDTIFKLGFGHKMGPLATADLIGLDTVLDSLTVLYESYCDPKYRPCPLLRNMVEAGLLGKKSGKGFFNY